MAINENNENVAPLNHPMDLIKLMRPHHWIKNVFVFTGILFGHAWFNIPLIIQAFTAALAFSLVASGIYILNDIADRKRDRLHPWKKNRPIAANRVGVNFAMMLAIFLWSAAFLAGGLVSSKVLLILAAYLVINVCYSFWLKHVVILDVFLIATGFMLRILIGTTGLGIRPSKWLLLCGLMLTLFLGFAKRRAEITTHKDEDKTRQRRVLSAYNPRVLDSIITINAACVVLSYSLYTMSPETALIQGTNDLIATVPFVVYAIYRYIFLLHSEQKGEDPSKDLMHDPHILISSALWLITTIVLAVTNS